MVKNKGWGKGRENSGVKEARDARRDGAAYSVGARPRFPPWGGHCRCPRSPGGSLPPPRQECGAVAAAVPMCLSLALPALLAAAPRRPALLPHSPPRGHQRPPPAPRERNPSARLRASGGKEKKERK